MIRALGVGAACLLLLMVAVFATRAPAARSASAAWPAPEELDSLSRYLAPSEAAPVADDYAAFLPAAPAPYVPRRAAPPIAAGPPPPQIEWRVSAILLAGARPLAIINDQQVRPGEPLPGGAQLMSIARDYVVIRESNGTQRTVRLTEPTEGPL